MQLRKLVNQLSRR